MWSIIRKEQVLAGASDIRSLHQTDVTEGMATLPPLSNTLFVFFKPTYEPATWSDIVGRQVITSNYERWLEMGHLGDRPHMGRP